jgi:hypothetical protein
MKVMPKKKSRNGSGSATVAGIKKEMSQPRVAKSAQKKYANLDSPSPTANPRKPPGREEAEREL